MDHVIEEITINALLNSNKIADNVVGGYSLQASLLLPNSISVESELKTIPAIIFMTTEMVVA